MKVAMLTASVLLLTACSSSSALKEMQSNLQHHHWELTAINGKAVDSAIKSDLEIGEHFTINGLAGCNRFFGSATIDHNTLIADPLASTRMACSPQETKVEKAVMETLGKGATIKHENQLLELTGEHYTLTYKLADWM